MGRTRSAARLAAREAKGWRKARRFCCSKGRGFPQENQKTSRGQTLSVSSDQKNLAPFRQFLFRSCSRNVSYRLHGYPRERGVRYPPSSLILFPSIFPFSFIGSSFPTLVSYFLTP